MRRHVLSSPQTMYGRCAHACYHLGRLITLGQFFQFPHVSNPPDIYLVVFCIIEVTPTSAYSAGSQGFRAMLSVTGAAHRRRAFSQPSHT